MIRRFLLASSLFLSLFAGGFSALPAHAQLDTGLQAIGDTIRLPSTDPRVIVARIINVALGLIGIILVVLLIYAGFLYMTSAGEKEKIEKALAIIRNAIIGLIIILSAWAITTYVINALLKATQGGGGIGGTGGTGLGGGFGGGSGSSFQVKSITPQGNVSIRNVQVKIVFSNSVDEASVGAITVLKDGITAVGGTLAVSGSVVTFTPSASCPAPNDSRKCFDGDSDFTVKVGTSLKSVSGQSVTCGGFALPCTAAFHTGNLVDTQVPNIRLSFPTDGMSVQANFSQDVIGEASDDSGVATVEFFDGTGSIGVDGPSVSPTPQQFTATIAWDTAGASLGLHTLSASASDIDTNTTKSANISVVVRAEHCFDTLINGGETGLNCGGDANSPEYCGACSGGSCTANADCSSGFCQGGVCVDKPVIKTMTPGDGAPGTFVTISGVNFGNGRGTVTFLGDPANPADDLVAQAPAACVSAGVSSWSSTDVIVAVPDGAASGPVEIRNVGSGLTDRTDQDPGPAIPDFLANSAIHPGVCAIQPSEGYVNDEADVIGQGFGATPSNVKFGPATLTSFSSWTDGKIRIKVPVVNTGAYPISVRVGAVESNSASYTVKDKSLGAAPVIEYVDPIAGPKQEYVTVSGKNFGYTIGNVIFTDSASGLTANGDVTFPPECSDKFWTNDHIVIKVPSTYLNSQPTGLGAYTIKVKRSDGAMSNSVGFDLTSGSPKPGICAISPSLGPVATVAKLIGEHFGFDKPVVTFSTSKLAITVSNTQSNVSTKVPAGAVTGPVTLKAGSLISNKVDFQVKNCNETLGICGPANQFQCCATGECRPAGESCGASSLTAEYAWQTSTGLIPLAPRVIEECRPDVDPAPTPSPSPWNGRSGGDQAPIDADIVMRFSRTLQQPIRRSNFQVLKCVDTGSDPCAKTEDKINSFSDPILVAENMTQDTVTLTFIGSEKFETNTTYLVTVSTDIKASGAGGANMEEMKSCGKGPNGETYGYCFRFKTRESSELTNVGAVGVTPKNFSMHTAAQVQEYKSVPLAEGDKCIVLNCKNYGWNWYTGTEGNPDSRASVTNDDVDGDGDVDCVQKSTGHMETGEVPVDVSAKLENTSLFGTGLLYITFVPPHVEAFAPNCDEACLNALVWARFSSRIDPNSVTPSNVELRKCFNQNCVESELGAVIPVETELTVPPFSMDELMRFVAITPLQPLEPSAFYHVLLKGGPSVPDGIKGLYGVPMDQLNHPQGFQWTFRVKVGQDAFCTADRVDVAPLEKLETVIDGRQLFVATPFTKPDVCSADGQALVQTGTTWSSSKPLVADLYTIQNALIDTGGAMSAGCTGSCLAAGANGLFGKVAVCGNGLIETTDGNFCKNGQTPTGKPCVVMAPGAKAGEECEPNLDGQDLCSTQTCLYRQIPLFGLGGSCGDGIVQRNLGEACDFGPTCIGASNATSSKPVPENTLCSDQSIKDACIRAGGSCSMHDYRGCSAACRHQGSIAGKTSCGNSDVLGDGKDCDDGNTTIGDGCSAICLHEGSLPTSQISSVCGNAVLEPGEVCERPSLAQPFPAGCSAAKCLHTGKIACTDTSEVNCCGNGTIESGEDCDDLNSEKGDGCSASCLFEGSNAYYQAPNKRLRPSFCGNGILEQGEQCEAGVRMASNAVATAINTAPFSPGVQAQLGYAILNTPGQKGDGKVDRIQLGYIKSTAVPDPTTGIASTTLTATVENKDGTADYGLQCGYTSESSCASGLGLDDFGCCRQRPVADTKYPSPGTEGVCRNVRLSATFNVAMKGETVTSNFEVSQLAVNNTCPEGTREVIAQKDFGPGVRNWFRKVWHRIASWWSGTPAYAAKWCSGIISGQLQPTTLDKSPRSYAFTLDKALAADTWYLVRFLGDDTLADNAQLPNKKGVKTEFGVVQLQESGTTGALTWIFKTGSKLCSVNVVTVTDEDPENHPYLFINAGNVPETRSFKAVAQSVEGGIPTPLSPVAEYTWGWEPWTSSDVSVVERSAQNTSIASFTSKQKNGNAILTATLAVTNDTVNVPSTKDETVAGIAPVTVQVCENPWPDLSTSPFRDVANSVNLLGGPFYNVTPYNFGTMYCRDAGVPANVTDDLPRLNVTQVPRTTLDEANGILRQYLFVYGADNPELKQDGIGIRIVRNDLHLSPLEWYRSKRFAGNPKPITVDGYPAIQDGTTIYVAAANAPNGDRGSIFSNIYVISHNPNATETTVNIYNQMVANLTFNINAEFNNQSNTCRKYSGPAGGVFIDPVYRDAVTCTADWECVKYSPNLYCDSKKAKLIRDTIRISDFQSITAGMESRKDSLGRYPQASAGTFLRGISTSLWSSWASEVGGSKSFPVDPVNRFLTCGHCSGTQTPCMAAADCEVVEGKPIQECIGGSQVGTNWVTASSTDSATCWDSISRQFICPRIGTQASGLSRFYKYQAQNGGLQYTLGAAFEIPPATTNWWNPALPDGVWKCVTTSTFGQLCGTASGGNDALCRPCANPYGTCKQCKIGGNACTANSDCTGSGNSCDTIPTFAGACRRFAGSYTYTNLCSTTGLYSENGTCGDKVLNTGETCELGETRLVSCDVQVGNEVKKGHRLQACNACTGFSDDPIHPNCIADSVCGNGRIDKKCNDSTANACLTNVDCAQGVTCITAETCDEGPLNGTYGHCNKQCNGISGYCGDGQLSPGEICDNGSRNGEYGGTCSLDCKGVGPYCGDKEVNGGAETCDGDTRALQGRVCRMGTNMETTCTTDADCGAGGDCGGGTRYSGYVDANGTSISVHRTDTCEGVYKVVNGIRYETQHIQTCRAPGVTDACTWPGWSRCVQKGGCGDGVKDLNEECDDGQENADNHACTLECKKNVCGDSKVHGDVEDCDAGADNGKTTCAADYNSSCLSCSSLCKFQASAGGYCGDKIKNGAEQCDGTAGLDKPGTTTRYSCSELGYDYGAVDCSSSCLFKDCQKCSENPGTGEIKGRVWDALFQQVVPNARVTLLYKGVKTDEAFTDNDGKFTFTTLNTQSACATYRIVIDMYQDNPCTNKSHEGVNCNAPKAPPFTYPYDIDEGALGGYFPFTSDTFGQSGFAGMMNGQDDDGYAHVDIFPRPERMKAYVAVTWKSQTSQMEYRIHTVLPTSAAFTATKFREGEHAERCDYAARAASGNESPQCTRDVYGFRGNIGDVDLQRLPYARLICLHRFGEKTGIWSDPENCTAETKCGLGCPLEGTDACLQALNKSGADYCLNSDGTIKSGKSSDPACLECKALGNYDCKVEPDLDNCAEYARFSPLSSIVNYAPHANQSDPIGFYLTGPSDDSSGVRRRIMSTSWKFVAYGAITPSIGDSVLYAIKNPSGSSGWIWHIADLDVKNEAFVTTNAMKGTDNDAETVALEASRQDTQTTVPVPGFSVWTYWFQGYNSYCLHDTTKLLNPAGTRLCRTQDEKDACEAKANYSCGRMSAKMYSQFNY